MATAPQCITWHCWRELCSVISVTILQGAAGCPYIVSCLAPSQTRPGLISSDRSCTPGLHHPDTISGASPVLPQLFWAWRKGSQNWTPYFSCGSTSVSLGEYLNWNENTLLAHTQFTVHHMSSTDKKSRQSAIWIASCFPNTCVPHTLPFGDNIT